MAKNGWEHYELEKEMADTNVAGLLELFKREDKKYSDMCLELFNSFGKLTTEGQLEKEGECKLQDEARCKVALSIAEKLTKIDKN